MDDSLAQENAPTLQWTVGDVLTGIPQSAAAFTRLRMACVGCAMARFDTVAEAAEAYGVDPVLLLCEIRRALRGESATVETDS